MSGPYIFGVREGARPSARTRTRLDAIGAELGAELVVGDGRTWWTAPNRGAPWDARTASDVAAACDAQGLGVWCPGRAAGRPHRGVEPLDRAITVSVSASQLARLERLARAGSTNRAEIVRRAIDALGES